MTQYIGGDLEYFYINLKKMVEIVEKLLYNRGKTNEKCKKQWKDSCIKYVGYVIILNVF